MLRKDLKQYLFSSRVSPFELILFLAFAFLFLAIGSIKFPREVPMGFLGICMAGLIFLLGPVVGFTLYFITTFFRGLFVPGMPVSLNQIAGVMFVLSWMNWMIMEKVRLPRGREIVLFTVLVLYFLINCLAAEDFKEGLYHAWYVGIFYFIALALASLIGNRSHFRLFFWIILVTSTMSAMLGAFEFVTGRDILTKSSALWMGRVRINGAAPNAIVFAYQLVFAFPLGYCLFSEEKSHAPRFLALGLSLFVTFIAILTFNRQTILVVGVVYFLSAQLFKNRYSKVFMGLVILVFLLASPYVLHTIWLRLQTIGRFQEDKSLTMRRDGLKVGMEMVRKHPFMGVGLGCYHIMWWKYLPAGKTKTLQFLKVTPRYPDMGYNQLLSEGGLIGFGIAISFFLLLLSSLWKKRKQALILEDRGLVNVYSALLILLIIFLLSSMIQDTFLYVRTWTMFGFILGSMKLITPVSSGMKRESENPNS